MFPQSTSSLPALHPVRFDLLDAVPHGVSTRHGGVSPPPYESLNFGTSTRDLEQNVRENRRRFARSVGADWEQVRVARLTHGDSVTVFRPDPASGDMQRTALSNTSQHADPVFHSDAAVSDIPGLFIFMTFADCVPLLFHDPVRDVVGAAHAGWRGTALGIAGKVVRAMVTAFGSDPGDIRAGIGPSIGPCCYAVGEDVQSAFGQNDTIGVFVDTAPQPHLDLWASNRAQLEAAGVRPDHIERSSLCTSCNVADFFSHRAEQGVTGRFGLLIGLE